jgi:uncharacterized cupin superfamily protein
VNILRPEFDGAWERDGYRRRSAGIGKQLGTEKIGGTLYELPDGEKSFPYDFHHGMEEWAIVVSGTPTLRGPDGERELRRGDVVCFPPRAEGAHQLRGPGTVLMLSALRPMEAIEYPDSGKLAVSPPRKVFRMADDVDYFEGES